MEFMCWAQHYFGILKYCFYVYLISNFHGYWMLICFTWDTSLLDVNPGILVLWSLRCANSVGRSMELTANPFILFVGHVWAKLLYFPIFPFIISPYFLLWATVYININILHTGHQLRGEQERHAKYAIGGPKMTK